MDLAAADCSFIGDGMIGNDLVNGKTGTIKGLDLSQQTVWTGIREGNGLQQLKNLIQQVQNKGYRNAMIWLATDTTVTEQLIIPENITIIMEDGAKPTTLTIAPFNNATGKGGMLISEGYLNITQSSKIVNNGVFAVAKNLLNLMEGATFENNGQLSNMGMARIRTGSKLINNGLIQHGSTKGDAVMNVEGEYIHGENAEIVNSFVITDNGMPQANRINGIDIHLQKLNHVIANDLPKHNETTLLQYFNAVSNGGYIGGEVRIRRDMEMRSNWYVEPSSW
jgi:hypothetical protein